MLAAVQQALRSAASWSTSPYLLALPFAVLFCGFAFWNGYPILFFDSIDYLQRPADTLARFGLVTDWVTPGHLATSAVTDAGSSAAPDDGPWMAGRSVWYGLPALFLSALAGPGAIVFAQAYLFAIVLAIAWIRGLGGAAVGYAVVCLLLLAGSAASAFAAIVLPDVLSGVAILAAATGLIWWERLARTDRWFLAGVTAFAAASHDSILGVLAAALVIALLAWSLAPRVLSAPRFRLARASVLAAGVCGGLAATATFHLTAQAVTGEAPLRLPFLTARLATADVGRAFLAETCPDSGFAVCAHQDKLGGTWIDFMFSADPGVGVFRTATLDERRRLSGEQFAFALRVVAHDPVASAVLLTGAASKQASMMSLKNFRATDSAPYLLAQLQPEVREPLVKSRVYRDPVFLDRLSGFYHAVAVLSVGILAAGVVAAFLRRHASPAAGFAASMLVGLALNAVICGVLASPYDRFQARVAWILPFAAAVLLREAYATRPSRSEVRPAPVQVIGRA